MEYNALMYIRDKYRPGDGRGPWSICHDGEVVPGGCQGLRKQSQSVFISGELSGVLEDSPGLMLQPDRGGP